MTDQVIKVAILDTHLQPQRLGVLCLTASTGWIHHQCIPVYPKGSPKPAEVSAAWEYTIDGNVLHVTPSLHLRSKPGDQWQTDFHNGFNWSIPFVMADRSEVDPDWETGHIFRQLSLIKSSR